MSHNQIDNFFKEKLNSRKFEFQESYWKDAEFLIEQEEKYASWKRLGLLLFFFLLGGLGLGTFTYFSPDTETSTAIVMPKNQNTISANDHNTVSFTNPTQEDSNLTKTTSTETSAIQLQNTATTSLAAKNSMSTKNKNNITLIKENKLPKTKGNSPSTTRSEKSSLNALENEIQFSTSTERSSRLLFNESKTSAQFNNNDAVNKLQIPKRLI